MSDLPKWRADYEALPEWVQKLVRGLAGCGGYGGVSLKDSLIGRMKPEAYRGFSITLSADAAEDWWDGFFELRDLASAMTAPWPPPPAPVREKRAFNVVELMTENEEGGGFNQPCAFGSLAPGHAVYCHNEAWPDGPRKCRRSWYTGGETRDEDCPGFVANPDFFDPAENSAPLAAAEQRASAPPAPADQNPHPPILAREEPK